MAVRDLPGSTWLDFAGAHISISFCGQPLNRSSYVINQSITALERLSSVTIEWIDSENSGSPNLLSSRDALSAGHCDEGTAAAITGILAELEQGRTDAAGTLEKLQVLIEQIRHTPKGIDRVSRMNAFVRTLGRADNLALFLELMRKSLKSARPSDRKIAERSRAGLTHCLYGWAGQSHVLYSERNPLPSTTLAGNGVEDHMGYPVAEWHASIHIWQPNP
jgi:hypothetical protein